MLHLQASRVHPKIVRRHNSMAAPTRPCLISLKMNAHKKLSQVLIGGVLVCTVKKK